MIQTTIGIDGMMCSMCEAHVNEAIRRHFTVKSAKANHKKGTCTVISEEPLAQDKVVSALGETGYRVVSFAEEPYRKRGLFG